MRVFLKYWLPVLIWLAVIFLGSTDLMSAEHTSRFLVPFLRWLKPDITAEAVVRVQFFVRKAAHLTEYAILAILFWRALRRGTNLRVQMSILFTAVWFACAIFAVSDEFHQSLVVWRTASAQDVLIDVCGAVVGPAIYLTVNRRKWTRPFANGVSSPRLPQARSMKSGSKTIGCVRLSSVIDFAIRKESSDTRVDAQ